MRIFACGGTWEHTILLGQIQLHVRLFVFRGQPLRVTRGDVNFANPLRIDPVAVEAKTTIQPYEITLNFNESGQQAHAGVSLPSAPS